MTAVEVPVPAATLEKADLARLLLIMQAAFALVAMLGELALMGSALYLATPILKFVLLMVLARKVVKLRRWALITTIVVESVSLAGFAISQLLSLMPAIDHTVTLVGVITELGMPITVIALCGMILPPRKRKVVQARLQVQVPA